MSLPNLLSALRLAIAPGLLYFAWTGHSRTFLLLLGTALLSDIADGYLARKLDQVSELGGQLDSWGDLATYLTAAVCAWWLSPDSILQEAPCVITVVMSYTGTTAIGFWRYRRLKSFHTWGGKISAGLLGGAAILLWVGLSAWPLRFATAVVVLSDLEEIAMMAVLPRWQNNVPSLWHAVRSRSAH